MAPAMIRRAFLRLLSTEGSRAAAAAATAGAGESGRPLSASFFTGKKEYYETLFFLEDVLKATPKCPPGFKAKIERQWIPRAKLSELLKAELSEEEHKAICGRLTSLNRAYEYTKSFDVKGLVDAFTFNKEAVDNQMRDRGEIETDEYGRVWAVGKRKTSVAKVCILKGDGKILVNARPLSDYFLKMSNLLSVVKPLEITNRLGVYNVWALAQRGGLTGQADAIRLGIAKALAEKEPELKPLLATHGLLTRDPRMVERKKPGKPKARKSFTWVKR